MAEVRTGLTSVYKRSLRNYLLNPRLQLRYALSVLVISAVVAGILGALIYEQSAYASRKIEERLGEMEWLDSEGRTGLVRDLRAEDGRLVLTMVGAGLGLAVVLFLYLIVMTHHVAGPVYRLSTYFDELRSGRLPRVRMLRPGDQFSSFMERLRDTMDAVGESAREDVLLCERFLEACVAAGRPAEEIDVALHEIRELVWERRAFLGKETGEV